MDIDTFLDGQAPESETASDIEPATPETPEPAPVAAETPSQPRDEAGRYAPKGEPPAAQPAAEQQTAPPAVEKDNAPPPGLLEERRKRQEAEQRYEELLQRLGPAQPTQPARPQEPALIPSIYEDENGFALGLRDLAVEQAKQTLMPEFQKLLQHQEVAFQEQLAASKYPDYEEKSSAFADMAKGNPALLAELHRAPNKAEFAYRYVKNAEEVQRLGSLDIEAIKAAAIAEFQARQTPAAPTAPTPPIPTSLADAQSARTSSVAYAPPSLNDILTRP
jgi:hypothetical protein